MEFKKDQKTEQVKGFAAQETEQVTELSNLQTDSQEDAGLLWTPIRVKHLVNDEWIDFREVEYRLPDGTTFSPYYNYSRRDYVVIVATDEEGRYLTVRQFRHGIRCVTNEFVAGGIEGTQRPDISRPASPSASLEQALSAAKRELMVL